MKIDKKKLIPYGVALIVILGVIFIFLHPMLSGKIIAQPDIIQHAGMSKEVNDYYKQTGEQAFWTSRLFSGMPTYLISMRYNDILVSKLDKVFTLFLHPHMGYIFLLFVGFLFLMKVLKLDTWISIIAALAFTLSSYFIIILQVGHTSKLHAIGYMAPYLASVILIYQKKYKWGALLATLFLALNIRSNHLQITYYLAIITLFVAIYYTIIYIKKKDWKHIGWATSIMVVTTIVGALLNFSLMYVTNEFSKETTRGKSELSIAENTKGLDKDYITQWSYGVDETMTFLIPNFKGGVSDRIATVSPKSLTAADREWREAVASWEAYWGTQPFTSGPVYIGAVVMLIFFVSLAFIWKNKLSIPLMLVTILAILLAWGRNFMPLTNFFIDYIPLYSKFRTPSMILVIAELVIPIFFAFQVYDIYKNPDFYKKNLKKILIIGGVVSAIVLFIAVSPSSFSSFLSPRDQEFINQYQAQGYNIDGFITSLVAVRAKMLSNDALRSLIFMLATLLVIVLYIKKSIPKSAFLISLGLLVAIDLIPINKRYLNESHFITKKKYENPYPLTPADQYILADNKDGQGKVLHLTVNVFKDASTAYYHRDIGGYNAAKLKRYQELIEFHLSPEIQRFVSIFQNQPLTMETIDSSLADLGTINMLNTKYIILQKDLMPLLNTHACGYAWNVNDVKLVPNADAEISELDGIDPHNTLVIQDKYWDQKYNDALKSLDTNFQINITKFTPNEINYRYASSKPQIVAFSEVFYPEWEMQIDGQVQPIMKANYVLRAAYLPAGKHEIKMHFVPKIYNKAKPITLTTNILFILLLIGAIVQEYLKYKKNSKISS
ncbi:MAG: YfhO family protein [Bacteroidales bacterium]